MFQKNGIQILFQDYKCQYMCVFTMRLYQSHSCRSSSCRCSSPPGCRSTAELQTRSLPSSFVSLLPGPATRTADCHLQQHTRQSATTAAARCLPGPRAQAQVGQGHGLYLEDCIVFASLALSQNSKSKYTYIWKCIEKKERLTNTPNENERFIR